MSEQRARSHTPATHRSAHPNFPGVPWWGAVVIATTATVIGFAFDAGSGNKELTTAFAALYFVGCVAAVLAVRQNSVFTAVVQPPLILFVAVPGAYYLFHQSEINGIKDILINCGYPLIERFLLMFTTAVVVLLIGAARWYFGKSARGAEPEESDDTDKPPALAGLRAKLSALINGTDAEDLDAEDDESDRRPRRHVDRPATAQRRSTARKTTGSTGKRPTPSRSRHARPPIGDRDAEPPRRRRSARPEPGNDHEPPPRRRPREPREPREPGSREYRPREREPRNRDQYERPPRSRPNRYDADDGMELFSDSYDAPPPRPRRPAASSGTGSTHHPVSRVRYRGAADDGDDRVEHRTRPRSRHSLDSDRRPYDD